MHTLIATIILTQCPGGNCATFQPIMRQPIMQQPIYYYQPTYIPQPVNVQPVYNQSININTIGIAEINKSRLASGVPALTPDAKLQAAAEYWVKKEAATRTMSHINNLQSFLAQYGYTARYCIDLGSMGTHSAGLEQVGGYPPGYKGPTHYGALHDPAYTHVGFAYTSPFNVTILATPGTPLVMAIAPNGQ